ncbi:antibiotic biosynthesis monooxygenase [Microbacterium sp. YMB-B2]|uniref:Antibiotic biosynthesis monooxygenase n=1 Tax=Microbacterium tenebrionis TaxID=2830665 RepID=A0A9X1LRY7_9MICO|nr:putative quinol monooxygenase [Microbacterium tenebrionis]MCC2030470.1 antibiotic biosynthesis monooxygenase [Microbacterium tenebrionis]
MSGNRVVLSAEFTALPAAADEVDALIQEYAQTVRAEPGNERFEVYRRAEDPDRFVVFEVYRDREAFDAHLGAEAGRAFNAALVPRIVEPQSVLSFLTPTGRS